MPSYRERHRAIRAEGLESRNRFHGQRGHRTTTATIAIEISTLIISAIFFVYTISVAQEKFAVATVEAVLVSSKLFLIWQNIKIRNQMKIWIFTDVHRAQSRIKWTIILKASLVFVELLVLHYWLMTMMPQNESVVVFGEITSGFLAFLAAVAYLLLYGVFSDIDMFLFETNLLGLTVRYPDFHGTEV